MSDIHKLIMPKWGLSMQEGKVVAWLVEDGEPVEPGAEIVEVETEKITGEIEASQTGVLRRVAEVGDVVPVAGLLGVITPLSVPAAEVDAFIAEFQANFVPPEADGEDGGPQTETVDVDGRTLRFLRQGDDAGGDPAVLLHGFGGDLNNWLFNQGALAAERTVYALDLPGHGGSSKQIGSGDLEEFRGVLAGFLDTAGAEKAHLVGHSMGGAIALDFALNNPGRVASLVLIASAGLGSEIAGDYIEGFVREGRRRGIKPHLEKLFSNPALVSRQLIDDILKYKRLDGVEAALRTIAEAMFPGGRQVRVLRDRLSELSAPVLVLWGEGDRILPVVHAEGLPDNVQTRIFGGQGHMAQMEAPAEVNRAITEFWR